MFLYEETNTWLITGLPQGNQSHMKWHLLHAKLYCLGLLWRRYIMRKNNVVDVNNVFLINSFFNSKYVSSKTFFMLLWWCVQLETKANFALNSKKFKHQSLGSAPIGERLWARVFIHPEGLPLRPLSPSTLISCPTEGSSFAHLAKHHCIHRFFAQMEYFQLAQIHKKLVCPQLHRTNAIDKNLFSFSWFCK